MSRRLIPVKNLSVMILAPRRHDRQLWADLLKNCGIEHPLSMSDISQATTIVSAGQADIVFVDESYGPQDIARILIPARQVEFAGGRGVCLILCSKKATAQDVLNARKLGFASLVILPASIDTVRKHLELAARYIPQTDEELDWTSPKRKAPEPHNKASAPKDDPQGLEASPSQAKALAADQASMKDHHTRLASAPSQRDVENDLSLQPGSANQLVTDEPDIVRGPKASQAVSSYDAPISSNRSEARPDPVIDLEDDLHIPTTAGRSGRSAEEEVVFL